MSTGTSVQERRNAVESGEPGPGMPGAVYLGLFARDLVLAAKKDGILLKVTKPTLRGLRSVARAPSAVSLIALI